MGHFLDPLLDEVKSKYSNDLEEAHRSGLREGEEYVKYLINQFAESGLNAGTGRMIDLDDLLDYLCNRPII